MSNLLQCKNETSGHGLVRNTRVASDFGACDSECVCPGLQVTPSSHEFSCFYKERTEDKNPIFVFSLFK